MHNPHTGQLLEALARLGNYSASVERFLRSEAERFGNRLKKRAREFPSAERGEYIQSHVADIIEIATDMPTLLRHSVLTAADSTLERYLIDTCRTYSTLKQLAWPPEPPWYSGLRGAQRYIKSMTQIAFPDQGAAWTTVLCLRELRNSLVHSDADISSSSDELRTWIKQQEHLSLSGDTVSLNPRFLENALSWYEEFARQFDTACEPLGLWAAIFPPEPDSGTA